MSEENLITDENKESLENTVGAETEETETAEETGTSVHANVRNNQILDFNSKYLDEDILRVETSEELYQAWLLDRKKVIYKEGEIILNPNYEAEKQAELIEQFNKEFFNTSLGYVRRKVTMKDGSSKDFLTDIVPLLQAGVQIITYSLNGTELTQNTGVTVTEQFITECKQQLFNDFYGISDGQSPVSECEADENEV
mgnify:CR=1 FL=1